MNSRIEFPIAVKKVDELKFGLPEIVSEELELLTPAESPFFVHMLGIPGAGKTTFARLIYDELQRLLEANALYLGFDGVMTAIPGYDDFSAVDRVAAFASYEIPAREAGYVLLKGALERRANVLFDHGGAAMDHPAILRYASATLGYKTFMVYIKCDIDVAKSRIEKRARAEGRHTPVSYIDDRYRIIESLIPRYTADVTSLLMVDNSTADIDKAAIASSLAQCIATIQRKGTGPLAAHRPHA